MKSQLCGQTLKMAAFAISSALAVASLAGCGASNNFVSGVEPDTEVSGLGGMVHGGPNPVVGATVTLYATTTTASPSGSNNFGYGVAGQVLGSTTTTSGGAFTLTGAAASCPAGQQAYIVAAGGHTGSNGTNSTAVLMAALGPCSGISNSTTVVINEPTTIAAAYTIGNFMTTSGTGASTVVNISAPAANNAVTPACTVVSNATTSCSAAGLAHAFLNAASLVNVHTGYVNATIPTGATITATVPTMLINTLANTVEACINSNGDVVTTTAPCYVLMNNVLPMTGGATPTPLFPSLSTPTNTLQALLDLAQYPSEATGPSGTGAPVDNNGTCATAGPPPTCIIPAAATTALFNVANSNATYAPALTSAPLDFTIAINYILAPGGTNRTPWGVGVDIKDNVYVYTESTPPTIYGLASNAAQLWSVPTLSTNEGCGSAGTRCQVNTDTLGNVWVADHSGLTQMNAATGALVGSEVVEPGSSWDIFSTTVDPGNNVWLALSGTGTETGASTLEELPQGATAITDVNVGSPAHPVTIQTNLHDVAFDTAGNIWSNSNAADGTNKGAVLFISSNNSLTAPAFTTAGTAGNPVTVAGGFGSNDFGTVFDTFGTAWFGSEDELNEIASNGSESGGAQNYAQTFALQYGGPTAGAWQGGVERNIGIDGDNNIIVDATSGGQGYLSIYYPNATYDNNGTSGNVGGIIYFNPCFVASGTTCSVQAGGGESTIVNAPRGIVVDASGTMWVTMGSGGNMIQLFGPGAPSWSQTSYIPLINATNTLSGRPY